MFARGSRVSMFFEGNSTGKPNNAKMVFVADDLEFLGPGILYLVTELCRPQDTA